MQYSIFDFFGLLGALGVFIYGMKIMSEGIQKVAGNKLRNILSGMTRNRFTGVITGFIITTLIQSSSATTVMVVSFVNAGLLNLGQSLGVIMGSNIGTTVTAWVVAFLGFKVKILPVAMGCIGIFFPLMFSKNDRLKNLAEFILGFGILFIGLSFLKDSVPDLKDNPEALAFLNKYSNMGFGSTLLFVLVGTVLTIIVQSSSASTAITLIMLSQEWIDFNIAAAMVLGENIGTTITANLAAIVGNTAAKRTARFHSLFNLIGVVWMLIIFGYVVEEVKHLAVNLGLTIPNPDNINELTYDPRLTLALFHSSFNVVNVVLLFPFIPIMEKAVRRLQPTKAVERKYRLEHISTGLMETSELSIAQVKKELVVISQIVYKMFSNLETLVYKMPKISQSLIHKIREREGITDKYELEVANYLTKVAQDDLSAEASKRVRDMLLINDELERISDIIAGIAINALEIGKAIKRTPQDIQEQMKLLTTATKSYLGLITQALVEEDFETTKREEIMQQRDKQKHIYKTFQVKHYEYIEKGRYIVQDGIFLMKYVNACSKIEESASRISEIIVD